jgi:hypothetical protein
MKEIERSNVSLVADIRQLIDGARQRVATTINTELTMLYWRIGNRIRCEVLQERRAEYGKQIVATLARQLTLDYGKGWGEKHLHHCLRIAEVFPEEEILYTLCRELSWSHLRLLMYIEDPIKRDFYVEMGRLERWRRKGILPTRTVLEQAELLCDDRATRKCNL